MGTLVTGAQTISTHKDWDDAGGINASVIKASYDAKVPRVITSDAGVTRRDYGSLAPTGQPGSQSFARAQFNVGTSWTLGTGVNPTLIEVTFYTQEYTRSTGTLGSGTVQIQDVHVSGPLTTWSSLAATELEHLVTGATVTVSGNSSTITATVFNAASSGFPVNIRWSVPDPGVGNYRYWTVRSLEYGKHGPENEKADNVVAAGFEPKLGITIA